MRYIGGTNMPDNKWQGKTKKQLLSQQSEIDELLETAMYKEVASQAFYIAGQRNTQDTGAVTLMKELAEAESTHLEWLKQLKEKGLTARRYYPQKVTDLKVSEYLTGGDSLEGAGLQDTLTFAIKREQQAIEFYSNMMGVMRDKAAKRLCQRFVWAELGHKFKLETFYDDLFYAED
jgi:rubrerythrin